MVTGIYNPNQSATGTGGSTSPIAFIEKRRQQLIGERDETWRSHWEDCAKYYLPRRERWLVDERNDGSKKNADIIDSTGTQAARTLMSGMMTGTTNPSRPWFSLGLEERGLQDMAEVRTWLDEVEKLIFDIFEKSNVYNVLAAMYLDLGVFGTSSAFIEEDPDTVIRATHMPIGSYVLDNTAAGRIDTMIRWFNMTARQLVEKFGEDKVSEDVLTAWNTDQHDTEFEVAHSVMPNEDFRANAFGPVGMKYVGVYYETAKSDQMDPLKKEGYNEFPVIAPRWAVTGNDVYGQGPGMDVLGDNKSLQLMMRRESQAVEKMVFPSMTGPTSLRGKKTTLIAGGTTLTDAATDRGGYRPAHEVHPAMLTPLQLAKQEARDRINRAFFVDMFLSLLMTDRPQMTATEVDERRDEKLLMLGPALERLNDEIGDPLIDRTIEAMNRRGLLPDAPDAISNQTIKIEYISILARAQKLVGLSSIERLMSFVANSGELQPSAVDKIDFDQTIDEYARILATPPAIINDDDEIAAMRAQRAKAAQQAAQMEQQAAQVATAKELSEIDLDRPSGLTALLGGEVAGVG